MSQILRRPPAPAQRIAGILILAGLLGGAAWLWWISARRADISFLPRRAPAEWIVYPSILEGGTHPRVEMSTLFQRSFTLDQPPANARLSVAGLHRYVVSINGTALDIPVHPGRNWKETDEFDAAGYLHAGQNQIAVTVFNTNGPPALWLVLDAPGFRLISDETWQSSCAGAVTRSARLATRPKLSLPGSQLYGGNEILASLKARWSLLLLFAVLSVAACWLVRRARTNADAWLIIALVGLWVALAVNNLPVLPRLLGFDVQGHLDYVHYLQENKSLPRADEGWEMFQPPLYYLLGSALLGALSLSVAQAGGLLALRGMGLAVGIAHFLLVWAALRLLFPGESSKRRWGLLLAAFLPPLLYLSHYVTNEALAAALASACVYLALRVLASDSPSWRLCASLGLCLGAALLAKSTALLVIPAIIGAFLWKWLANGAASSGSWTARLGLMLGICLALCGWHYARLWHLYGNPFIGVWDPRTGFPWWQDDGYHTASFYRRFGDALLHPWFASARSFGDGIYSTLWGDGLLGGMSGFVGGPPWNYDLMAIGYWLALVPTAAILLGGIVALKRFVQRPSPEWFLVLGLAFLVGLATIHMSISVPYLCMVKAFYGLSGLVPLCALGALGFDEISRRLRKLSFVLPVLFGLWAINSYATFWIPRSSSGTFLTRAQSLLRENHPAEAEALLRASLRIEPRDAATTALLAEVLNQRGDRVEALNEAELAVRNGPASASAHIALAEILGAQLRTDEAIAEARRALELAPGDVTPHKLLAGFFNQQERSDEAIQISREGLAVSPFNPELHAVLGQSLAQQGAASEGIAQLQLALAIKPAWPEARASLASVLVREGRPDEAAAQYRLGLAAGADKPALQLGLGEVLLNQGSVEEAADHLREAVRLDPSNAVTHCELAMALAAQHQVAGAISHYNEALRLNPESPEALNNLAWIRAANSDPQFRDGVQAVRLAMHACELSGYENPMLLGTLAVAYAENQRFDDATATATKARDLALASGQKEIADKNQTLIELFSAKKPYRERDEAQKEDTRTRPP